jgi:hypothetical protein
MRLRFFKKRNSRSIKLCQAKNGSQQKMEAKKAADGKPKIGQGSVGARTVNSAASIDQRAFGSE